MRNIYSLLVMILLIVGVVDTTVADQSLDNTEYGPLVVHFDKNKARLNEADKQKIRNLLRRYDLGKKGRIFVVGYTDSTGAKTYNYKLSRRRAQAVRREIISAFGVSPLVIMALGKGSESPFADNLTKAGRAENRRAEIYLFHAADRQLLEKYHRHDPHLKAIDSLIQEAKTLVRQRKLAHAFQKLEKARLIGGDQYSDWHAIFGVVGFYAGIASDQVREYLQQALRLDHYNFTAREFLGRLEARENVVHGRVKPLMGQSPEDAIAVTTMAQEYEYLRLFRVTPLARKDHDQRPLDIWECRDQQGQPVVYFFDHAQVYAWAFAHHTQLNRQISWQIHGERPSLVDEQSKSVEKEGGHHSHSRTSPPVSQDKQQSNPQHIWESELFQ